jgi:hypothetical protein
MAVEHHNERQQLVAKAQTGKENSKIKASPITGAFENYLRVPDKLHIQCGIEKLPCVTDVALKKLCVDCFKKLPTFTSC